MTERLPRNAVLAFAAQVVPMLAALVSLPLLVRFLGAERIGLLSMIWLMVSYFSVLDVGISVAVTRSASIALAGDKPGSLAPIVWSAAGLQLLLGGMGALALIGAAPLLATRVFNIPQGMASESILAIRLCAVGLPGVLLSGTVTGTLQAASRFDILTKVQAPVGAAQYLLPAILAWQGAKLPLIVLVLVALRIGALVVTSCALMRLFPEITRSARLERNQVTHLLSFGIWVMISAVISPLLVYADRLLIANRLTLADVAYYSVPLDAIMRLLLFSSSISSVLYPAFSGMTSESDTARTGQIVHTSLKYILCATGIPAILIWIYAPDLLRLWINPEFAIRGGPVLRILIFGIIANAVSRVPYSLLQSRGYPKITALIQVASLPAQLAASLYLMLAMGIRGAAVAWSGRLVLEMVCLFYFASRVCKLDLRRTWAANRITVASLGAVSAFGSILAALGGSDLRLQAAFSLVLAVSGSLLLWTFALSKQDRVQVRSGLRWRRI